MNAILTVLTLSIPLHQAQVLTDRGEHELAIAVLATLTPTPATYNTYCYLRAVNSFAVNNRNETVKWLGHLNDTFHPLERRHAALAQLMGLEVETWVTGDLHDIERDMRTSGDRLTNARTGKGTQDVQRGIVEKLDRLIEEAENKGKGGDGSASGSPNANPTPGQSTPATDSSLMGGRGEGKVDEKKLRATAEQWGQLTPAERSRVVNEITNDLPVKYKQQIDLYFKSLNKSLPKP